MHAQNTPLAAPQEVKYPGIYESFETLVGVDQEKIQRKKNLLSKNPKSLSNVKDLTQIDIDVDFLNSVILNSKSSYLHLAARNRCSFYDSILTDLLQTSEGKVDRLFVVYQNKAGDTESGLVTRDDFINNVIFRECPDSKTLVGQFQIKTLDSTIKETNFGSIGGQEQCLSTHYAWEQDPKSPYYCQVYEVVEAASRPGAVQQKVAVANIIRKKFTDDQFDFLTRFCRNADNSKKFCDESTKRSFWSKLSDLNQVSLYLKDICTNFLGKPNWSMAVARECLRKLRDDPSGCLYGNKIESGLAPHQNCQHMSLALNTSTLRSDYEDCPGRSDHQTVTNVARLIHHLDKSPTFDVVGSCSALSGGLFYNYNKLYDNEDIWNAALCYDDKPKNKEVCLPMMMGDYAQSPISLNKVMGELLYRTKGAPSNTTCKTATKAEYNPNLLSYKDGCFIVSNPQNCGLTQCDFNVYYNERPVTNFKIKNVLTLDYFPTSAITEKTSQVFTLGKPPGRKVVTINSLTQLKDYYKIYPGMILHGVGCAEDLLPSFFRKTSFNQCQPLPFILDGFVVSGDKITFSTRTALDDLQAPRLVSWGNIYSSLKSYQTYQPQRLWTLHAIQ